MFSYPRNHIRTWVSQAPRMMDTTGQINAHALVVNRDAYVRDARVLSQCYRGNKRTNV